jgi:hypothetical protein
MESASTDSRLDRFQLLDVGGGLVRGCIECCEVHDPAKCTGSNLAGNHGIVMCLDDAGQLSCCIEL